MAMIRRVGTFAAATLLSLAGLAATGSAAHASSCSTNGGMPGAIGYEVSCSGPDRYAAVVWCENAWKDATLVEGEWKDYGAWSFAYCPTGYVIISSGIYNEY